MDGVSVAITLVTFAKEIVELGTMIYDSVEKVRALQLSRAPLCQRYRANKTH